MDCLHEAPDLDWLPKSATSTSESFRDYFDRIASIFVYRLHGCSKFLVDVVEGQRRFYLKFYGLTMLVAHAMAFQNLGRIPRTALTLKTFAHLLSWFSLSEMIESSSHKPSESHRSHLFRIDVGTHPKNLSF